MFFSLNFVFFYVNSLFFFCFFFLGWTCLVMRWVCKLIQFRTYFHIRWIFPPKVIPLDRLHLFCNTSPKTNAARCQISLFFIQLSRWDLDKVSANQDEKHLVWKETASTYEKNTKTFCILQLIPVLLSNFAALLMFSTSQSFNILPENNHGFFFS